MINAQQWLDKKYSNKLARQKIERLAISPYTVDNQNENAFKLELEGPLNISDFVILKKLYLYSNKLTKLIIINCPSIELISCTGNLLTDLDFLSALDPKILTDLYLENNNIYEHDLGCFGRLTNLTTLLLGNSDESKINQGIYNRFIGSLKFLQNLTGLKSLSIQNTDIDSGLEYLPSTVKEFRCSADQREGSRVRKIEKGLKPFLISVFHGTYDFNDWREKREGKVSSSSEQEKVHHTYKRDCKAKRRVSQKEIKYQKSCLEENKEKERQQFQQTETNYYKK